MNEVNANSQAAGGRPAFSLDIRDYASRWEYHSEVQPLIIDRGSIVSKADPVPLEFYSLEGVVYCANPTNPELQVLNIYVPAAYMKRNAGGAVEIDPDGVFTAPTGETYTAKTAPIIYYNSSGGYGEMSPKVIGQDRTPNGSFLPDGKTLYNFDFLKEGFIFVGPGGRGKTTKDASGNYTGKIPASAVDLKAGIRFMRHNDKYLPGDTEKIVSIGFSSGGAMSTILGAEGNCPLYAPYLEAIGAADARDDICAAVCCAPITNLDVADLAFEWLHLSSETYTLFTALGGGTHSMDETPFYRALSAKMYDKFVEYVRSIGLDLGTDGRSGKFYEGFIGMYEKAIGDYVALYLTTGEEIQAYMDTLDPDRQWLVWDSGTRSAKISDMNAFVKNYLKRMKWVPSLDTYDYVSNEGSAFALADGTPKHFSSKVAEAMGELLQEHPEYWGSQVGSRGNTTLTREYFDAWVADIDDEMKRASYLMTPVNFVINDEDCTIAPHWRFRTGSKDADHGAIVGWLMTQALKKRYPDLDVTSAVVWAQPHCAAEYQSSDLMNYVHHLSAK